MARQIDSGVGRNSGLTSERLPATCHSASTTTSPIHPAWRLVADAKPAPRNGTGLVAAEASGFVGTRSSILHLALGIDSLTADQRPQVVLNLQQLLASRGISPVAARHRHRH